MIRMVKGTYGRVTSKGVEAMTKHSAPFSLSKAREDELVAAGVAVKVEEPAQATARKNMKMAELRKIAAAQGVDVSAAKKKEDVIAILEAAKAMSEPEAESGEE